MPLGSCRSAQHCRMPVLAGISLHCNHTAMAAIEQGLLTDLDWKEDSKMTDGTCRQATCHRDRKGASACRFDALMAWETMI